MKHHPWTKAEWSWSCAVLIDCHQTFENGSVTWISACMMITYSEVLMKFATAKGSWKTVVNVTLVLEMDKTKA